MPPHELCQRLLEWLATQPADIRAEVLSEAPTPGDARLLRRILLQIRHEGSVHPGIVKRPRA
jgi:hypothetical protein